MRVLVSIAGLAIGVGAGVALPRVAHELPGPLAVAARWPERLWTRFLPPRMSLRKHLAALTRHEREATSALARTLDGLVVWSSNRSGNHELYLLDLRKQTVRQLTHNPHVDFFSRFSPDGRRVLFLRSQREWVSFREAGAWDVMLVNVDGTGEELLVRGGYHPTWADQGTAVVFERGLQLWRLDLATRAQQLLLDGARDVPGVEEIGDFELSHDSRRLAFGLRGRFDGAFGLRGAFSGAVTLDLTGRRLSVLTREQACQTTWAPDDRQVLWVETGGSGGTRVMAGSPDGSDRHVFMDLPGAYSHEYFPKLSSDGRWLVWGAAAEGHEHDRADYEIFVWQVGVPWERAVRLTHHAGNDQWPDLWVRPPR
jgi:dipeptidyl aminopeptidase/acylaminoacyl peptidase